MELGRELLATLYDAVDEGALAIALPKFVKKELEGYLDCGLLCRGFARLRCDGCEETRLVAFSCKGRGFCPSCVGRKMAATAAHLIEDVLPTGVPLRQWVLTVPFAWRKRLGYDGPLLSALTRLFVKTVLDFYRARVGGAARGQSGAVVAVQRTSSDLKLNPHVHAVFLDGVYREKGDGGDELASARSSTCRRGTSRRCSSGRAIGWRSTFAVAVFSPPATATTRRRATWSASVSFHAYAALLICCARARSGRPVGSVASRWSFRPLSWRHAEFCTQPQDFVTWPFSICTHASPPRPQAREPRAAQPSGQP